MYTKAQTV